MSGERIFLTAENKENEKTQRKPSAFFFALYFRCSGISSTKPSFNRSSNRLPLAKDASYL
jgi:hypothetical protein